MAGIGGNGGIGNGNGGAAGVGNGAAAAAAAGQGANNNSSFNQTHSQIPECKMWRNPMALLRGAEYQRFYWATQKEPLTFNDMNISAQDHQTFFTCEGNERGCVCWVCGSVDVRRKCNPNRHV